MSTTTNYGLYITDDSSETFQNWRRGMNGVDDSNMIKIDNALYQKADKSKSETATLLSSAWTGENAPYTQTISVENLTAEQNGNISVSKSSSFEQRDAARAAMLSVVGQQNGSLTIAADGDKPETDIPVDIILFY